MLLFLSRVTASLLRCRHPTARRPSLISSHLSFGLLSAHLLLPIRPFISALLSHPSLSLTCFLLLLSSPLPTPKSASVLSSPFSSLLLSPSPSSTLFYPFILSRLPLFSPFSSPRPSLPPLLAAPPPPLVLSLSFSLEYNGLQLQAKYKPGQLCRCFPLHWHSGLMKPGADLTSHHYQDTTQFEKTHFQMIKVTRPS